MKKLVGAPRRGVLANEGRRVMISEHRYEECKKVIGQIEVLNTESALSVREGESKPPVEKS
jgi:hypothetical protein